MGRKWTVKGCHSMRTVTVMETTRSDSASGAAARAPLVGLPRVALVVGALAFVGFGLWAMLAPRSFFDAVATFDPYNQHFVQDIGAFQIGIGAVLGAVLLRPASDAAVLALAGAGAGALAHVVSHVVGHDLGGKPSTDIPTFLLLAVLLLAGAWARARELEHRADGS